MSLIVRAKLSKRNEKSQLRKSRLILISARPLIVSYVVKYDIELSKELSSSMTG